MGDTHVETREAITSSPTPLSNKRDPLPLSSLQSRLSSLSLLPHTSHQLHRSLPSPSRPLQLPIYAATMLRTPILRAQSVAIPLRQTLPPQQIIKVIPPIHTEIIHRVTSYNPVDDIEIISQDGVEVSRK